MTEDTSFQDLLDDFSDEIFVGRSEQLGLFKQVLSATRPPFLILALSGQGGVGKTTLLEQFRHEAHHQNILTALVNEDQTNIPLVLSCLVQQFEETGCSFSTF